MVELAAVGPVKINAATADKKPAAASGGEANRAISETFAFFFARNSSGDARATVENVEKEKSETSGQNKSLKMADQDSEATPQDVIIATEGPLARDRAIIPANERVEVIDAVVPHQIVRAAETLGGAFQVAAPGDGAAIIRDTPRAPTPNAIAPIGLSPKTRAADEKAPRTPLAESVGATPSAAYHIITVEPAAANTNINLEASSLEPVVSSAVQLAEAPAPIATTPAPSVQDSAVESAIASADPLSTALRSADGGLRLVQLPDTLLAQGRSSAAFEIASIASRDGGGIELRLDPPELGAVTIQFFEDDAGALRASVAADKAETLDLLRRNADALHRELARHGAGEFLLSFSQRRDDSGRNGAAASAHPFRIAETPSALVETRLPEAKLTRASGIDLIA